MPDRPVPDRSVPDRSVPDRPGLTGRRLLGGTVLALVAAAAALGGAAALSWARTSFAVPLRGVVPVEVDGGALAPVLGPLALVALAAVAAVLATAGWLRRLLGGLLVLAAVPAALGALAVADRDTVNAVAGRDVPTRATPTGDVAAFTTGPALAVLGAVLLAAAGAALLLGDRRLPRLGARYRTPAARRATAAPADRERGLWDALDAGEDPTERR